MPRYLIRTPLLNNGKRLEPGGEVELDATEGELLAAIGAVELLPGQASGAPDRPLARMTKAELLAVVAAEGVEVAADATNPALIAAIEAKRAEAV